MYRNLYFKFEQMQKQIKDLQERVEALEAEAREKKIHSHIWDTSMSGDNRCVECGEFKKENEKK